MAIDYTGFAIPKVTSRVSKHADQLTPEQFRLKVWARERGRDRATGQIVYRNHANWQRRGQVCHLRCRRVAPEWAVDPDHSILLSDYHHQLSDHRGGRLLKILDPWTLEPATDARLPILFRMHRQDGKVIWERVTERR